jgi:tetratricopeptide (TPR) repeat protein
VAVLVASRPSATNEAEAKEAREVEDSRRDRREELEKKGKDWFRTVDDPTRAEIIIELKRRGWEANHGAVLEGERRALHLDAFKKHGKLDQAIQDFSDGIRLKPDLAAADYNRTLRHSRQGKRTLAAADRARAPKLDPQIARWK